MRNDSVTEFSNIDREPISVVLPGSTPDIQPWDSGLEPQELQGPELPWIAAVHDDEDQDAVPRCDDIEESRVFALTETDGSAEALFALLIAVFTALGLWAVVVKLLIVAPFYLFASPSVTVPWNASPLNATAITVLRVRHQSMW